MDIRAYINLIQNHKYDGKIGIVKKDVNAIAGIAAKEGQVVLYRPNEVTNRMSEEDFEYHSDRCAIEFPYSKDQIAVRRADGNYLTTFGCCVGVPLSCIEEIIWR